MEVLKIKKRDGSWIFAVMTMVSSYGLMSLLKEYDYKPRNTIDLILLIIATITYFGILIYMIFEMRKSFVGINGGSKSIALLSDRPSEKK